MIGKHRWNEIRRVGAKSSIDSPANSNSREYCASGGAVEIADSSAGKFPVAAGRPGHRENSSHSRRRAGRIIQRHHAISSRDTM